MPADKSRFRVGPDNPATHVRVRNGGCATYPISIAESTAYGVRNMDLSLETAEKVGRKAAEIRAAMKDYAEQLPTEPGVYASTQEGRPLHLGSVYSLYSSGNWYFGSESRTDAEMQAVHKKFPLRRLKLEE